jgi:hypothetical protein
MNECRHHPPIEPKRKPWRRAANKAYRALNSVSCLRLFSPAEHPDALLDKSLVLVLYTAPRRSNNPVLIHGSSDPDPNKTHTSASAGRFVISTSPQKMFIRWLPRTFFFSGHLWESDLLFDFRSS